MSRYCCASKGGGEGRGPPLWDRSFPFIRRYYSREYDILFHDDITFSLLLYFPPFLPLLSSFSYIFFHCPENLCRGERSILSLSSFFHFPSLTPFIPRSSGRNFSFFFFQWCARSTRYKCGTRMSWRVTQECSGARYLPSSKSTSRSRPGWRIRPSTFTRPRRAVSVITSRSTGLTRERKYHGSPEYTHFPDNDGARTLGEKWKKRNSISALLSDVLLTHWSSRNVISDF